ncbi:MAG TPA: DUF87 domain-containing protein [Thermoanaerobaculales bacterium]|nr:DUF87 domain-containing protein [Thermoanaerobaculales bacterium]
MTTAEFDALREFVETYRLDLHDQLLARELAALDPERPRATDARVLHSIRQRVAPYQAYHEAYPFVVAPTGTFSGSYILAYQLANRVPIKAGDNDITRHGGIFGSSGCGKTTFTQNVIQQVLDQGKKVFILDPKDDSFHVAVHHPAFLVLSPRARLNLLQVPSALGRDEFLNVFTHVWGAVWYAGENQKQVLDAALVRAFSDHETPCLADVQRIVDAMHSPKLTYQRRDSITGVSNRLARFGRMFPVPVTTRRGITYEQLFQHPLYMNALFNDEHTVFIYTLLVYLLYLHNRRTGIRNRLDYLLVNDEGNRFWNVKQSNIGEAPTLVHLQGMLREFGIGLFHTSIDEASLHPILKSNTYLHVAMNVASGHEESEAVRNLGLTPEQRHYLQKRLTRGHCIIRFGDGWREPILGSFPYKRQEKQLSQAGRRDAEERINQYAPADLAPAVQTDPPADARPATTPPADTPGPTLPLFPAAVPSAEESRLPVKLAAPEERLLRTTTEKLWIATAAYEHAHLSRQAGQTAKDKLVQLGLLRATSILVRPRRGGNGVLLEPTAAAFELLGRPRPHLTKGGDSGQHRWFIQELAARIPDAGVELTLGGKSIDLVLRYDPGKHERLFFSMEEKPARDALIAIEVECSDPLATAVNNVTKNAAVGITLTLVAVLPRHLGSARAGLAQRLPAELRDAYTVVDVFTLLEDPHP